MALTGSRVDRGLVLAEPDQFGMVTFLHLTVKIALAVCGRCGHRARVLPCDALPHKTFGASAIELVMAEYREGRRSLRQVAWAQLGERTPAHTSLHGWTEGFGLHALGRDGLLGAMRWSRLLEEAIARFPRIAERACIEPELNPQRYRSLARRERLSALLLLLAMVTMIAGEAHPHAMAQCRRLSVIWTGMSALEARSQILRTRFEHQHQHDGARSRSSAARSVDSCPMTTRSPPGDSS
jgi:hypothetical protein